MNPYLSVSGDCVTQKTIEKSRFITTSRHVEDEEQAKNFIAEISSRYADATHNCYAYICDSLGNFLRFSDDGEPQGTAGMPILEVIKNKKLMQTAVVVTRYFGGIKLGAGGLVRAYSGATAENLDTAQKVSYEICSESLYRTDYSGVDTALRYFSEKSANVLDTQYSDEVLFRVAVKETQEQAFN
ncbi:MAG: YigZ family protein, partial [Clostridia bacterium]|nr:YigZ family protein [Clostridia bacterium]